MIRNRLLDALLNKHPNRSELIKELSSTLYLSDRAVRNRLNGKTSFTVEELETLVNLFDLSPVALFDNSSLLHSTKLSRTLSAAEFINTKIDAWLQAVQIAAGYPNCRFYLSTNNFPILLGMRYPILIKLKLYLLGKLDWHHPEFLEHPFSAGAPFFGKVDSYARSVDGVFREVPSTEIWGVETFISFLRQIDWLVNSDNMVKENMRPITEAIKKLVDRCERYTEATKKSLNPRRNLRSTFPEFELVYNPIMSLEECTLLSWSRNTKYYSKVYHPLYGFLQISKQVVATEEYFVRLQQTGTNLSQAAKKERSAYFDDLREQLQVYFKKWGV